MQQNTDNKNKQLANLAWHQLPCGQWQHFLNHQTEDKQLARDYIWLVCQNSSAHKIAGYRLYNDDIESFIEELAAIEYAVVFGVPNEQKGNEIHLSIELASNKINEKVLTEAVQAKMIGKFGEYARPASITFSEKLPAEKNKKIARQLLKSQKITMSYVA